MMRLHIGTVAILYALGWYLLIVPSIQGFAIIASRSVTFTQNDGAACVGVLADRSSRKRFMTTTEQQDTADDDDVEQQSSNTVVTKEQRRHWEQENDPEQYWYARAAACEILNYVFEAAPSFFDLQ